MVKSLLKDLFLAIFFITLFLLATASFTYAYFARDLTTKENIMNSNDTGVTILDRNYNPFFTFYQAKQKTFIPISQIPKSTQQAVVAAEDKDFYSHPGFSLKAIIGSLIADVRQGKLAYGGSTLTQQLVKNAILNPNKNFLRKYQEIILAYEIERKYSKDEILEMYLNSVYFGSGAFGIEQASQNYFSKPAKDLTLSQSALLAGLLPAPSRLSPLTGNLGEAQVRQRYILGRMVVQGYISPEQSQQAANEELAFHPRAEVLNNKAIHFALMVKDELVQKYGEEQIARSGFKVVTTIDPAWQDYSEKVVADQVAKLAVNGVTNGAAVVMDPKTGEIKALVGSKNWYTEKFGQVNIATSSRQPGSAFKPIVYSAALEEHLITPATILQDKPVSYGGKEPGSVPYRPVDYDRKFRGPVTARRALANSLNVPSVEVLAKLGVPQAVSMGQRLGLTTLSDPSNYGLSLVLGAAEVKLLELTSVYATFANEGQRNEPVDILKIQDKQGQEVYSYSPNPQQILEPEVAFLISSILSDNNTRAEVFGNTLNISRPAAVKTGTTENYRDAWTLGYTPSLTVGVWVGNNDGRPMDNIAGSLGAAPIWKALMEKFSAGKPVEKFSPPENIATVTLCKTSNPLIKEATASAGYKEYFIQGTQPKNLCTLSPTTSTISPSQKLTPTTQPQPTPTSTPTVTPTITPTTFISMPQFLPLEATVSAQQNLFLGVEFPSF